MKPKIILITALSLLSLLFIVRCKSRSKNDDSIVKVFLNNLNSAIKTGKTDSIMKYFAEDNFKSRRLVNLLAGNSGVGIKSAPIFKVNMDIDGSIITQSAPGVVDVNIPINFSRNDTIEKRNTILTLKLNNTDTKHIKIIQIDGTKFLTDYIAYENLVKSKTLTDKDIFAPITLKSFITAKQLKPKYDSVIWFSHINNQTYFYVTTGKWDIFNVSQDSAKNYKMGLVAPDLKEIIPPDYDLVHNINGTFKGMVEVEKDHKRGLYSLDGKLALPVEYDQIIPVSNDAGIAALRKGDDYFWLNKDFTVSPKADIKIADVLAQAAHLSSFSLAAADDDNLTEFNSREQHGSLYIPPSYLADLGIVPSIQLFKNPTRKNVEFEEVSDKYNVILSHKSESTGNNMFASAFYSIRDYFLGGRSEFYDKKNLVIIDKKRNKAFTHEIQIDYTPDGSEAPVSCTEYNLKMINDTLFEVKVSANVYAGLPDENESDLREAPSYHYLYIKNNKLVELNCDRFFAFTKFVKMDDSYLQGCYSYGDVQTDYLKTKYLQYMKNEIFADYHFKFKNIKWSDIFSDAINGYKPDNEDVDDSLTVIDKYNINWIAQKLKQPKAGKLVMK